MSVTVFEDPRPESGRSMQEYIDSHSVIPMTNKDGLEYLDVIY